MRGVTSLSSGWHHVMAKHDQAKWAEIHNWDWEWVSTKVICYCIIIFFKSGRNSVSIIITVVVIMTLKTNWPILFAHRGSITFGQRFWLHLWNRVPCQGSRRAHRQTAHGTERADSEEKDDPSDKVRREGKWRKKSVCHFSILDLGNGGGRSGSTELGLP